MCRDMYMCICIYIYAHMHILISIWLRYITSTMQERQVSDQITRRAQIPGAPAWCNSPDSTSWHNFLGRASHEMVGQYVCMKNFKISYNNTTRQIVVVTKTMLTMALIIFYAYKYIYIYTYILTLPYIALHYIALHCIALHYIALHYIHRYIIVDMDTYRM